MMKPDKLEKLIEARKALHTNKNVKSIPTRTQVLERKPPRTEKPKPKKEPKPRKVKPKPEKKIDWGKLNAFIKKTEKRINWDKVRQFHYNNCL